MSLKKKDDRVEKFVKKDDKLKKYLEEELAKHERWLSQHKPPNLGDNDANPEYIAEYHEHRGKFNALINIKTLLSL